MKLPFNLSLLLFGASALLGSSMSANTAAFRKDVRPVAGRTELNPYIAQQKMLKAKAKAPTRPAGTVLYEDFEEWTGLDTWTPAGWTFDHKIIPDGHPLWRAYGYDPLDPVNYPSTSYIFYLFTDTVDEWLISPEFTIENGMVFQADCYNAGSYYFNLDSELFTSDIRSIEKVNDFIVHITTDGGATWTPLYSMADELLSHDYTKGYEYWDRHGWETIRVSLEDYAGKTAKIAFQIVGEPVNAGTADATSQSSGVDNIYVGFPRAEVSYQRPEGAMYFGLTDTDDYVPGTFMVVPVHHPVTFPNTSNSFDTDFSWSYEHTDGTLTSTDIDLTVVYGTNHESEKTSRNNIYSTPVLTGGGEGYSEAKYSMPGYIQAGGRGEYQIHWTDTDEWEWLQLGLTVADPQTEGTSTYADITVPYFGYNNESDRYWTMRTFGISSSEYEASYRGDDKNWNHLTHYGNLFYASDHPIVIDGIRTNGYGRGYGYNGSMPNAKFTAEIYFLDENFTITETPAYSVDCTGADIKVIDRYSSNHILCLNFKFDEPIVISKADCPYFLVAITGFRDADNIEYFSPEMSAYDNPEGLALGWVGRQTCWDGYELPLSWGPVLYHTEEIEPAGEQLRSFFIMLDGTYPWLEGESEVEIPTDAPVTVALDSYYDGSEITVEGVPSWLKAEVTGRYGNTKLTLTPLANSTEGVQLTLKAPGVSKKVNVGNVAGIADVTGDDVTLPAEYFNLQGIRIQNPQKGDVVIRRQGTTATKIIIR